MLSYGYIRPPKQILSLQRYYQQLSIDNGASMAEFLKLSGGKPLPPLEEVAKQRYQLIAQMVPDPIQGDPERMVKRWVKVTDFNPSSTMQLQKYIKWKRKELEQRARAGDEEAKNLAPYYEIPKNLKTGKPTTSSAELKQLVEKTGDPLLAKTIEIRSINTNLNNFYPNWEPGPDGAVHSTIGFAPPSGQLNTINPNVQNLSKHTRTGQVFRRMVHARKGRMFVCFDKSRFHVVMMGREARCPEYIKFGMLDCHSIFTSWICGSKDLEVDLGRDDDATVKAKVKEIKARFAMIRDKVAKPSVLGNQLGLGARKLYWMNRKYIKSERAARALQAVLAERFGAVERYKAEIARKCYDQTYLLSEFGAIRYLYDVLRYSRDRVSGEWKLQHGEDYEKALAFRIQHHSFGQMKEEWYAMSESGLLDRYFFVNTIHDSNEFEPAEQDVTKCICDVWRAMVAPCHLLSNDAVPGGLTVGTGVSIGKNMQYHHDLAKCKIKSKGGTCWMCDMNIDNPEGIREIGCRWKGGVVGGEVEIIWD